MVHRGAARLLAEETVCVLAHDYRVMLYRNADGSVSWTANYRKTNLVVARGTVGGEDASSEPMHAKAAPFLSDWARRKAMECAQAEMGASR